MNTVRRSLAYSLLDRYASLAVTLLSSMVLARLLSPSDIGAFSVTMVAIGLMTSLRDFGAGQYLVQEQDLTQDRIRAVWTVQMSLGMAMGLLTLALAEPAAHFYDDRRVRDVMLVLAAGFFLNPIGSITYAWLMREMRYEATMLIRLGANLASALTAVTLAYRGAGAISLAWGSLAATCANVLLSAMYRPASFPLWPGRSEVGRVLGFGLRITTSSWLDAITKGAPEFFLGRWQDLASAGYYSRAMGLVSMFNRLITDAVCTVALSGFAQKRRESQDTAGPLLVGIAHLSAVCWSFAAALALLAPPVIRLLYGSQWEVAADLARWLCAALAIGALTPICTAVLISAGETRAVLVASAAGVAVAVPGFLVASLHGLTQVAVTAILVEAVITILCLGFAHRLTRFRLSTLVGLLGRSLIVSFVASLAPIVVVLLWGRAEAHTVLAVTLGGSGAAFGMVAGLVLTKHPLAHEIRWMVARLHEAILIRRRLSSDQQ